jgi:excisionase family DNA binding protein
MRHVFYGPLLSESEMTTAEAAELANVTTQAVRKWIGQHRIGRWDGRLKMFIVNRSKLEAFLEGRKKRRWFA